MLGDKVKFSPRFFFRLPFSFFFRLSIPSCPFFFGQGQRIGKIGTHMVQGRGTCADFYFFLFYSLAYAELYLTIGTIIRRFDMELFETDLIDVVVKRDHFVPSPDASSRGVRVRVLGIAE